MTDLPEPAIAEAKFKKPKRYRHIRVVNYSGGAYNVFADVDETNRLTITVAPAGAKIPGLTE